MGRRLTLEEAKFQVAQFDCELIGEYNGAFEPVIIKCVCGNIRSYSSFNSFVCRNGNHLCYKCGFDDRHPFSNDCVEEKLQKFGCHLIGDYLGFDKDIGILCLCGHVKYTTLNKFVAPRSSKLCDECTRNKRIIGRDNIIERFNAIGLNVLDNKNFDTTNKRWEVEDVFGYKYATTIYNAERNARRNSKFEPFCRNNPFTFDNMNLWLKLNDKDFEIIELIVEEYLRVISKCYICGGKWETGWDSITGYNTDCPLCRASSGEVEMRQFFVKNKISYDAEHTFSDCKRFHRLPFDFYLPEYNGVCEYSGIQHFEPIDFGGRGKEWALQQFEELQIRDEIKEKYCLDNNIPLLKIPYWDFSRIPEILTSYLNL